MLKTLARIDRDLLLFANGASNPVLDAICGVFNLAGSFYIVIPVVVLLILAKDRQTRRKDILTALVCLIAGGTIVYFLKEITARPRPSEELGELVRVVGGGVPYSGSFPSGHSQMSLGAVTFLWLRYKKWALPLFLCGALCAISRVYCGMHFPSDILVGSAIGIASSWGVCRASQKTKEKI